VSLCVLQIRCVDSVLYCVARHCSVMQCVADGDNGNDFRVSARAATEACCSVMQCVATCYSVLLILMMKMDFVSLCCN